MAKKSKGGVTKITAKIPEKGHIEVKSTKKKG